MAYTKKQLAAFDRYKKQCEKNNVMGSSVRVQEYKGEGDPYTRCSEGFWVSNGFSILTYPDSIVGQCKVEAGEPRPNQRNYRLVVNEQIMNGDYIMCEYPGCEQPKGLYGSYMDVNPNAEVLEKYIKSKTHSKGLAAPLVYLSAKMYDWSRHQDKVRGGWFRAEEILTMIRAVGPHPYLYIGNLNKTDSMVLNYRCSLLIVPSNLSKEPVFDMSQGVFGFLLPNSTQKTEEEVEAEEQELREAEERFKAEHPNH